MADNDVDIKFGANVEGLEEGSERGKEAIESLKKKLKELEESGERVHELFEKAFEFAGIEIGIDAFREWIVSSAELGEQMERAGAMLGVTASQASELSGIAKMTGTDFGALEHTMERFQVGLASTDKASSHVAEALRVLGSSAREFIGVPMPQQLQRMAEAFSHFADGPTKTAAAMALLGRAGAEMIPYLDRGKEGLEELHDVLERTGAVMTNETAGAFAAVNEHLNEMRLAWEGLSNRIFSAVAPAVDFAITKITSLTEHLTSADINAGLVTITGVAIDLATQIMEFCLKVEGAWRSMLAVIESGPASAEAKISQSISNFANEQGEDIAEGLNQTLANWGLQTQAAADKVKEAMRAGLAVDTAPGKSALNDQLTGIQGDIAKQIAELEKQSAEWNKTAKSFLTPPNVRHGEGEGGPAGAGGGAKPSVPQMQLGGGGAGKEDHTARDNAEADAKADLEAWAENAQQKTDLLNKELAEHQITMAQWAAQTKEALGDEAQDVQATYAAELQILKDVGAAHKQIVDLQTQEAAKLKEIAHQIAEADDKAAKDAVKSWDTAMKSINSAFDSQINALLTGTETWHKAFLNVAKDLTEQLIKLGVNKVLEGGENLAKSVLGIGGAATQDVAVTANTTALGVLTSEIGVLIAAMTGNTAVTSAQATSTLANTVSTDANTIATNFQAAVAGISSLIPKFASGTPFVPHNMLALVHQGEMVVPAQMNPNNPANSNSLGGGSFGNPGPAGGQSGATGGGGGVTHNHNYGGVHIDTGGRELDPDALASAIQKAHRGGHFNRR